MTSTDCTGHRYPINPDAPEEGTDVRHDVECPVHPELVPVKAEHLTEGMIVHIGATRELRSLFGAAIPTRTRVVNRIETHRFLYGPDEVQIEFLTDPDAWVPVGETVEVEA
jgi:hypothetical protein